MRARIGDLAIVRFDPSKKDKSLGKKWDEQVGIVTEHVPVKENIPREYKFIYWHTSGNRTEVYTGFMPPSRLIRARPINDDWEGTLYSLSRDNVQPV